jgi:hypothetical protein
MSYGFDDWVYWHFFTVTVVYNSSHIELLLNEVCLMNFYEESVTVLNARMNSLFITAREPDRDHRLLMNALSRKSCVNSEATVWFLGV